MSTDSSFAELLKAAKAANPSPLDTLSDDFFDDCADESDLFLMDEDDFVLSEYVAKELAKYKPFRLTPKAEQLVTEFLTFQLQVRRAGVSVPETASACYNLIVRSEDLHRTIRLVQTLQESLCIPPRALLSRSEEEFMQAVDAIEQQRGSARAAAMSSLFPLGTRIVFVHSCKYAPLHDLDLPTGSAIEASRKQAELYKKTWDKIINYVKTSPNTLLIVHADNDVYSRSLARNTELFHRVCGHHIFLAAATEDDLFADCMAKLNQSSFDLAPNFEKHLRAYFRNVYPKAELRSLAFVDDLIGRIFSLYFCKERSEQELTLDCIPKYNTQVITARDILGQMNQLIGLEPVKKVFRDFYTMRLSGLESNQGRRYHMLFTGNPGTGKTTIARMTADLLYRMEIIKTNKLTIAKASDLISMWNGGTAQKTLALCRRAYDGVLFIDEAYGLADANRGPEALNVLIQEMEEASDRLIIILAGYKKEMDELLDRNPGLQSRIDREISFDDYTLEELVKIFHACCQKDGFSLDASANSILEDCISGLQSREYFGNARDINNLLQHLKEAWASELYARTEQASGSDITAERVFYPRHFQQVMPPKKDVSINDLVGLENLKTKLEEFKNQVLFQKHLKEKGLTNLPSSNMHMLFMGNPGTGKTTVARLIADDLYAIGVLKTNRLVVAERKDLVSPIPGHTASKTAEVIRKAIGGVLFIDEAYSLTNGNLGHEVIEVLLTAMEEHKTDTIFIFAGYVEEMQTFLAMNPGLQSRIGYTFQFDDYTPEELTQMYKEKLITAGFTITPEALEKITSIMKYFQSAKNFGNGRFVDHILQQTLSRRATRNFTEHYRDIDVQDIPEIKVLIETAPNGMHLYDPAEVTDEEHRRTAVHELGHAIIIYETNPSNIPERISIKNEAGSLGRVTINTKHSYSTEVEILDFLAVLLGGKNAERLIFGTHAIGCSSDYARAKQVAAKMIEVYAMNTYGETSADIIKSADARSTEILVRHRSALERLAPILLEKQELTGQEFVDLMKQ